ncbi:MULTISPECIES: hypothetical protein [unclassified Arthrobacter]|uniref:hypothetical protein n=1 Tax=unclassified Arthrobacter TaxID=235627 RepID=UPI002882E8D9|nr:MULTISPECIES: hypothetical protein [unclassified Arthrobacter]
MSISAVAHNRGRRPGESALSRSHGSPDKSPKPYPDEDAQERGLEDQLADDQANSSPKEAADP